MKIGIYLDERFPMYAVTEGNARVEIEIPEAQYDWLEECSENFEAAQQYLAKLYEEAIRK